MATLIEDTISWRGGPIKLFNGFRHRLTRNNQHGQRWKCTNNRCNGSIYIDELGNFIGANSHNHDKPGDVTVFELNGESIKIYNGFTHRFKRNNQHGQFWKCINYQCSGSISIDKMGHLIRANSHNHCKLSKENPEILMKNYLIKSKAEEENGTKNSMNYDDGSSTLQYSTNHTENKFDEEDESQNSIDDASSTS